MCASRCSLPTLPTSKLVRKNVKPPLEEGINLNIPIKRYQLWDAISYGPIRAALTCPALAKYMLDPNLRDEDSSRYTVLGTAVHDAILLPHYFDSEYQGRNCTAFLKSGGTCGKKAVVRVNKEWFCQYHASLEGGRPDINAPVTADQEVINQSKSIREAVRGHAKANYLLEQMKDFEVSYLWKDDSTDLLCKSRPDAISEDGRVVIDLKTTSKLESAARYADTAFFSGYFHQAAMTRRAMRSLRDGFDYYYLIVVDTSKPHLVSVFQLDEIDIDFADADLTKGLHILKCCYNTGRWPGLEAIQKLSLSPVRRSKIAEWSDFNLL